jgi:hypothetical protein
VLVIIQHPISDSRAFAGDLDVKLPKPTWGKLDASKRQFVHFTGRIVDRRRSADHALPDEEQFCLARRAMRLELPKPRRGTFGGPPQPVKCAFRRLLSDGNSNVIRFEVGLKTQLDFSEPNESQAERLLFAVTQVLRVKNHVNRIRADPVTKPILRQGSALAKLFAAATEKLAESKEQRQLCYELVDCGTPIVFVELQPHESLKNPAGFKAIKGFGQIVIDQTTRLTVGVGNLRVGPDAVATWIVDPGTAPKEQLRSLRLCLLRLHAEQECLDLVLNQIQTHRIPGNSPDSTDRLNDYLNRTTRFINRGEWMGIDKSGILSAFDVTMRTASESTQQNRAERFEGARTKVWEKVQGYQIRRMAVRDFYLTQNTNKGIIVEKQIYAPVTGDGNVVNIEGYMNNVRVAVNKSLGNSKADSQAILLTQQLMDEIEKLSKSVEPAVAKQLGSDAQALASEMSQEKPRQKWYELSLGGLKEAAEALGAIAAPVTTIVSQLIGILLPK